MKYIILIDQTCWLYSPCFSVHSFKMEFLSQILIDWAWHATMLKRYDFIQVIFMCTSQESFISCNKDSIIVAKTFPSWHIPMDPTAEAARVGYWETPLKGDISSLCSFENGGGNSLFMATFLTIVIFWTGKKDNENSGGIRESGLSYSTNEGGSWSVWTTGCYSKAG